MLFVDKPLGMRKPSALELDGAHLHSPPELWRNAQRNGGAAQGAVEGVDTGGHGAGLALQQVDHDFKALAFQPGGQSSHAEACGNAPAGIEHWNGDTGHAFEQTGVGGAVAQALHACNLGAQEYLVHGAHVPDAG